MLAGGAPIPTGRKGSCPISLGRSGAAVARNVGLPSVVTVVAKTVVHVLETTRVVSIKVKDVDVAITVVSTVDVIVESFDVMVTTSVAADVYAESDCSGRVATVEWVTTFSMVVVGTEMVCVVVDSETSVVLVNGAYVVNGSRVEAVTEGRLVGNGGTAGLPPVSSALFMLLIDVR